jgi:hypothetical protein
MTEKTKLQPLGSTAGLGYEITVGREHICRDAELHAQALRYVDGLMLECIEMSLRSMPGNEVDGPLHWRLRKGREKLRAAVESLERVYLVEVPNNKCAS